MKLIDKYIKIQKIGDSIKVPWKVMCTFGAKEIYVVGNQISIGAPDCDYVNFEQARESIEWYAEQLGGKVKWEAD